MIRVDVILICIRSNDAHVPGLLHRLEHTQPGSVGILKNDIDTARDLCDRLLFPGADIIPVADVRNHNLHFRIDRFCTLLESLEASLDGRELSTSDHAEHIGLRHSAGDHSSQI